MAALPLSNSSRLMPGLRGAPAVTITMSEPAVSSQPSVALMEALKPLQAAACDSSSALPKCIVPANWGSSCRTTSQMSRSMSRCAMAPPVMPAPTIVTFFRAIVLPLGVRICAARLARASSRDRCLRSPSSHGSLPIHWARGSGPHPQFLHHCPHRPRQVDARRSLPRGHGHRRRARHGGPGPRHDGSRARAGHHHQGRRRPHDPSRARRRGVRVQPDRYPRARRLHLRGLALPRRLRGRRPRRRRLPGHRGPDLGQRLPRPRPGADPRPRHQQDRPAPRRNRARRPRA